MTRAHVCCRFMARMMLKSSLRTTRELEGIFSGLKLKTMSSELAYVRILYVLFSSPI